MNSLSDLFLHGWEIHPSVVVGCLALCAWYFVVSPRRMRHTISFLSGVIVLCLSLISPIDPLGDQYLFSAHMFQHLLLILIVPPLLILGLTKERVEQWMTRSALRKMERHLGNPTVAWCSNMFMMLIWHLPIFYNTANANVGVHIAEHLCFIVTGCMFWWPIFSPMPEQRMEPTMAMLYLFGAAAVSTLLGIILTFLHVGHYQPYMHPNDVLGALHLIRNTWGISAAEDQKLAGLLMWVPWCSVYFAALLFELGRWYLTPDPDKQALLASVRSSPTEVRHG